MKKNLTIVVSAVVALSTVFISCESTPSTKASLTTEMDSVSYSFGASIGENIDGALYQMQVLKDTMSLSMEYKSKIEVEQDATAKEALAKDMRRRIDSLNKENEHGKVQFLQGLEKAIRSRPSQSSYNVGYSVGSQINMQGEMMLKQFYGEDTKEVLNKEAVVAAVAAAIQKKPFQMVGAPSYLMMKSQEMQQKEMEKMQKQGEANAIKGEEFLAANKLKDGVVELESGVQYKILKQGDGAKPTIADQVKCHYHGTLLDGTVFDSSVERGEPADFGVGQVIPGWTEVLQLMPVGSQWEIYIPQDKAYGMSGSGEKIGPGETLIFQIELFEIASR